MLRMIKFSTAVTLLALGMSAVGCKSDDAAAVRKSELSESCQTSADCSDALVCRSGQCAYADLPIQPVAKECHLIACEKPLDCCPTPSSQCASYKASCDASPLSYACDTYKSASSEESVGEPGRFREISEAVI